MVKYGKYRQNVPSYNFHILVDDILFLSLKEDVMEMNRLKELREDHDLYQRDIAKLIHIDQSNYSKYELEKINIPVETLHLLADYYNTSIDYILYRTDERKPYKKSIVCEKAVQTN